jgi:hypothetical protein
VKLYSRPGNAWHFERETSPYVRNAAISRHFERDPIPYALDSDWPVEAGGFEPLHFGIRSAAVDHGLRLSSGMRSGTTNFN